jgi:hypothetical protein
MASTYMRYESSGLLPVETPKNSCVCSACWQWRGTSSYCECLSDYLQLPWHLWMDVVDHYLSGHALNLIEGTLPLNINVLYELQFTTKMFLNTWWQGYFYCFGMWELAQSVCTFWLQPAYTSSHAYDMLVLNSYFSNKKHINFILQNLMSSTSIFIQDPHKTR